MSITDHALSPQGETNVCGFREQDHGHGAAPPAEPIGYGVLFRLPGRDYWRADWPEKLLSREAADAALTAVRAEGYEAMLCALVPVKEAS